MSVLKYNAVRYSGGIDIKNTVDIPIPVPVRTDIEEPTPEPVPEAEEISGNINDNFDEQESEQPEPRFSPEEILVQRETELIMREREVEKLREELAALRESYIEQGKEVILEAKRRADGIVHSAEQQANEIVRAAEMSREDIRIKARAEGFEQGKKDGVAACMAAGQSVLDEAREYVQSINDAKAALFEKYEADIFETVMEIANKVTLNSMAVKDGTAAKKLIKKAAKDFRNSELIRITLNENGATTELAGDYEALKELCGGTANVEVELLAEAQPGTVIVDNGEEITDAGIQTQLKMIRELGSGKFANEAPKKRATRKKTAPPAEE